MTKKKLGEPLELIVFLLGLKEVRYGQKQESEGHPTTQCGHPFT